MNIHHASRNARILSWLRDCSADFVAAQVAVAYAEHLQCPLCEIDTAFTDPEDLDWVYLNYHHAIELHAEDRAHKE